MKVAELIKVLSQFPPDANVTMTENIVKYDEFTGIEWDIVPEIYIHIDGDCLICAPDHSSEVSKAWRFGNTGKRSNILVYKRVA